MGRAPAPTATAILAPGLLPDGVCGPSPDIPEIEVAFPSFPTFNVDASYPLQSISLSTGISCPSFTWHLVYSRGAASAGPVQGCRGSNTTSAASFSPNFSCAKYRAASKV